MKTKTCTLITALLTQAAFAQVRSARSEVEFSAGGTAPQSPLCPLPGVRVAPEIGAGRFELPATITPAANVSNPPENVGLEPTGYVAAAPDGLSEAADWQQTANGGWVWALELYSPSAQALRVQFRESFGRDGLCLRVYDPKTGTAFGPYSVPRLNDDGEWWTTIVFGSTIGLEFYMPPGFPAPTHVPAITAINYTYSLPETVQRACTLVDVSCFPNWQFEADAVCVLAVINNNLVSAFCTGALLWRQPNDADPLVMTANHCIGTQSAAANTSCVWFFQTSSCNGVAPNINTLPRSDGTLLLKRYSDSDWNLVGLLTPPASTNFLGWTTAPFSDGDGAVGISHPSGSFKRIQSGVNDGSGSQSFCDSNGNNCFTADEWYILWSMGFVQPGSSGSPIMDTSGLVRGTLTGGSSDCTQDYYYGRLDEAFVSLQFYISNAVASPVIVNGAVGGDPGNEGTTEQGNPPFPFNTVFEATFSVRASDTIQIVPGHYNEKFTLWRPMTLARNGNSGTVLIGAP